MTRVSSNEEGLAMDTHQLTTSCLSFRSAAEESASSFALPLPESATGCGWPILCSFMQRVGCRACATAFLCLALPQPTASANPPHPLTPGRIINLGRDRIHQPQACVSQSSKRNHNSSVLKILQIILFVFKILQIGQPVSGLFGRLCTIRYPGGTPMSQADQSASHRLKVVWSILSGLP